MTKTQPDRYTVLSDVTPENLPKRIREAENLGLFWFAKGEYRTTRLYLFFDELGMQKYMNGDYSEANPND